MAELAEVVDSRKNILSERCFLDSLGIYVEKSIVYDKEHRLLLIFLKDINKEEQEAKRAAAMRRDNQASQRAGKGTAPWSALR